MNSTNTTHTFVPPEVSDLAPFFPSYEIYNLIAAGGMGAVYAGKQKSLDRMVAIKILPKELSGDETFRRQFEAEAKAMARLNHPNLIGVYDFGEVEGMLFIIMEFVEGKSLYHSAYGKKIDPMEALHLVMGICSGLVHAHKNGILHRDIKPANILLTTDKIPKIGDFGLARPVKRDSATEEIIYGTPGYTAPEVFAEPESVDQRADLYSLGVMLYELLTGSLPAKHFQPASQLSKCDVRFDEIIQRSTDADPAKRYESVAAMMNALQEIVKVPESAPSTSKTKPAFVIPPSAPAKANAGPANDYKVSRPSVVGLIFKLLVIAVLLLAIGVIRVRLTPNPLISNEI